ncbi:MAG: heme NO-binding domain-containing protein [Halieaceae bacterium]
MYGLINNALREMITSQFGDEQWQKILAESGVPEDSFLTMRSYDDALTYSLAGAASTVLDTPVDKCLELFGEFWIEETAGKSYGMLMDATGQNMVEFLENLNGLHDRITSTFLDYKPPSFRIEALGDTTYKLHYESTRKGFTPFVVGLIGGLARRFDAEVTIESQHDEPAGEGTHTVFGLEIAPR